MCQGGSIGPGQHPRASFRAPQGRKPGHVLNAAIAWSRSAARILGGLSRGGLRGVPGWGISWSRTIRRPLSGPNRTAV